MLVWKWLRTKWIENLWCSVDCILTNLSCIMEFDSVCDSLQDIQLWLSFKGKHTKVLFSKLR